jgi:hypothetical protein
VFYLERVRGWRERVEGGGRREEEVGSRKEEERGRLPLEVDQGQSLARTQERRLM